MHPCVHKSLLLESVWLGGEREGAISILRRYVIRCLGILEEDISGRNWKDWHFRPPLRCAELKALWAVLRLDHIRQGIGLIYGTWKAAVLRQERLTYSVLFGYGSETQEIVI